MTTTTLGARAQTPAVRLIVSIPIASVAIGVLAAAARSALDLDRRFPGLDPPTVAATTAIALTVGAVLTATLRRYHHGHRVRRVLLSGALLSLIGPSTALFTEPPDGPAHSNAATSAVLICLHAVAALIALRLFRATRSHQKGHR